MPIYEYKCDHCNHQFEAIRKISDEPLTICPACGRATLKKLISKAAFRLKGGGWYETDFKSKGKKNVAGERSEGGDSSAKEGGDGKAQDAKKASSESPSASESSAKKADKSVKTGADGAKSTKSKSSD